VPAQQKQNRRSGLPINTIDGEYRVFVVTRIKPAGDMLYQLSWLLQKVMDTI